MLNVHGTDYTSVYRPQKVHFFLLWFSLEYGVVFFFLSPFEWGVGRSKILAALKLCCGS